MVGGGHRIAAELRARGIWQLTGKTVYHIFRRLDLPVKRYALKGLLWAEGLACYAVRMVYPKTLEEDVLDWRPLIDQTKPLLPDLVNEAMNVLRSDSPHDIAGFFYFPRENRPDIPTGCGYYIGMLIAEKLAHKQSIETLLTCNDAVLIDEIRSVLIELQG